MSGSLPVRAPRGRGWTRVGWVGHSDGLGPMMSMEPMYRPWNSVHENGGCDDTAPKGGAGRIYCFAVN